ncbi:hypothetical protein AGMMS49546_35830 [Spirochaetia bacterium]|nr:hypothetical protein AGMMS49546_35830 [Spirochaetia bacterium]
MKKTVLLVVVSAALASLVSCGSSPKTQDPQAARRQAIANSAPIRTEPAQRPAWVDETPKDSKVQYFVGMGNRQYSVNEARNAAYEDARRQLVDYYGTVMVNKGREYTATLGLSSETFDPQTIGQRLNERIAQNVSQALGDWVFFTQVYFDDVKSTEAYVVAVRGEVAKSIVARTIDTFGQEQAADLKKQAAAAQDAVRRQQLEKAAEFFGGNLSSTLGL